MTGSPRAWLAPFMTQRQLAARGLPPRADRRRLIGVAKLQLGVVYLLELGCVLFAGAVRSAPGAVACVGGLIVCHVVAYAIESRPANRKPRSVRPA